MSQQSSKNNIPSFLIIGVQKAATSWLYACLKEHPDIFIPSGKREVNFLGGRRYIENGWDWWINRFSRVSAEQIAGDVSVDYIYSKTAPELIKSYLGKPKFIAILRNPIERLISAYFWNVRRSIIPNLDINEGIKHTLGLKKTNFSEQTLNVYKNLIDRGFYDEQIEHYLCYHDLEQFYFIDYDDIGIRPRQTVQEVYRFLNVDSDYVPRLLHYKPKRNTYITMLISLERALRNSHILSKSMDLINFIASVFHLNQKPPALDKSNLDRLKFTYQSHNENLKHILEKYQKTTDHPYVEKYDWVEKVGGWNN